MATLKVSFNTHFRKKKFNYSVDAADHMIFDYYNNARLNADLPPANELPAELRLEDELGEFEPEPTEEEERRARYAGLTPVVWDDEDPFAGNAE